MKSKKKNTPQSASIHCLLSLHVKILPIFDIRNNIRKCFTIYLTPNIENRCPLGNRCKGKDDL